MNLISRFRYVPAAICLLLLVSTAASSSAADDDRKIALAEGKIEMEAPEGWVAKQPKFRGIVQYEFAVPKVGKDTQDGRCTLGATGGRVDDLIKRWANQYVLPAGTQAKQSKKTVAGLTVHRVDVSGTYTRPPFSGGGQFKDYRLLAVIIESKDLGLHYVKFNGPQETVGDSEEAFDKMIDGLSQP